MRRSYKFFLISALLLWLAGDCAAQPGELRIGVLQELTGPVAQLGATCQHGMNVALRSFTTDNLIGDTPVKLLVADVHNDAKASVTEFQRLVDVEHVQAVVTLRSLSAMPINPLSKQKRLPLLGIVGAKAFTVENEYALRVYMDAAREAAVYAELARKAGRSRAVVVALEDEFALALANGAEEKFKELGGEIAGRFTLLPDESDFSSLVTSIRNKKPDVIFAFVLSKSGLFFRKLAEAQLEALRFTNYWIQSPDQAAAAGKAALETVIFGEVNSDKPLFKQAYQAAFPGEVYNPAAYLCYAALGTALQALKSSGALASPDSLRAALLNVREVELLDGPLHFENREAIFDLLAKTFKNGLVVPYAS